MNMKNATFKTQLFLLVLAVAAMVFLAPAAFAAAPGITTTGTFQLTAQDAYLNMPDGEAVYSWGYGCASGFSPNFLPAAISNASCGTMQVPGPTLIVNEGSTVTISLTNNLPTAAGNTSILFPGFTLTSTCPNSTANPQGLLACEAAPGQTVTYIFTASAPGTHAYYSGTQGDLQIEMGLYGAIIVLPATIPANCNAGYHTLNATAQSSLLAHPSGPELDFRLAHAAYEHPASCYDREYLFQWAEMDHRIHRQAEAQVAATASSGVCPATLPATSPINPACSLSVQTEPYHPAYFLINGRSMPDLMDPNYASEYPHQPYNGNPHLHPGELMLLRTIGQGRWEHPFHEHANHVRILARDANLELTSNPTPVTYTSGLSGDPGATGPGLAGLLMFNTDTTPGEAFDGIFTYTGRGLNWDAFGHHPPQGTTASITAISEVGNTVTVTVSGVLPVSVGPGVQVGISGVTPAGFDGPFFVVTSVSPGTTTSTFTYTNPTAFLGSAGAGGTATFANPGGDPYGDANATLPCTPDVNGLNSGAPTAINFMEWCQDHYKPIQVSPFGDVPGGGPATFPDPNVFTNGAWYSGTPYFGPDANLRAGTPDCAGNPYGTIPNVGPNTGANPINANCTNLQPANVQANPANERGWAFMWHSHNEREITTNNVFPGGMLMMLLVDSREFVIDESQ
jgi:FtsP/CotA-like multicopper oxidase with cupredoxin domain